jgi:hypothetical protein
LFVLFIYKYTVAQGVFFHVGLKARLMLKRIDEIPFKDKFTFGYQEAGGFATISITSK